MLTPGAPKWRSRVFVASLLSFLEILSEKLNQDRIKNRCSVVYIWYPPFFLSVYCCYYSRSTILIWYRSVYVTH